MIRCEHCQNIITNKMLAIESIAIEDGELRVIYFCSNLCKDGYLGRLAHIRNLGLDIRGYGKQF